MASSLGDGKEGGGAYKKVVDQVGRRKFNLEEYERRGAIEQDTGKKNYAMVSAAPAQARKDALDLEANVGKYQVVSINAGKAQQGGFYCETCDYLCKDSIGYLEHVNGKRHQHACGIDTRPERSTLDGVRQKLDSLKRKASSGESKTASREEAAARLADLDRALNGPRKKKRKKDKKDKQGGEDAETEADASVTTSSSSSSSSSSSPGAQDGASAGAAEEAEAAEEVDPEMAAMAAMGFGFAFGGSKKTG
jgi:U4/U6.U5 tri-snRNP component SNU23